MLIRYWPSLVLALTLLLVSCVQQPIKPTPTPAAGTPIPPIKLGSSGGSAKASGKVVPAQKTELGFPAAGRIEEVRVAVGQEVLPGTILVTLEHTAAEAAVAQASATLTQTQAALAELKAGPQPAALAAAQAKLDAAQALLAQLTEAPSPVAVTAAQAELTAAQAAQKQLAAGPTQAAQVAAQTTLSNTLVILQQAQTAYDKVAWRSDIATLPESLAWHEATNNYLAAKAQYAGLFVEPTSDVVATAMARVQKAQADLDHLLHPATAGQRAEAEANVRTAQAALDLLKAGAQAEAIAAAQAAVAVAAAGLQQAEANLANTTLRAPFTSTVTLLNVNPGQAVTPGQPLLTLADLHELQVETTDLSERDVAKVTVGQKATIFVGPLGETLVGRVIRIAPQATVIGGDVVYTVTIALEKPPPNLRWGMSVEVTIQGE
ncbi:MAG: HlyD family efflux transporter periplasmic adaptor subunit [Caldilineaceae bacterium]